MGVLARRFLNLIVPAGRSPGVKSLRRIDLTRNQLFYGDTSENPAVVGASMAAMEMIRFSGPSLTFRAVNNEYKMDCFPLEDYSECKLICADQSGRGFIFDLDSSMVGTIPTLRKPWLMQQPISVFVHKPLVDGNIRDDRKGSGLFVMEKFPQPETDARRGGSLRRGRSVQESEQFVGFINHSLSGGGGKSWHYHLLPPPPFVRGTRHWYSNCPIHQITAYGVVGCGSHVCISVEGAGTYCLDTESLTWSKASHWTLPFCGKVEYVPALKLWFGFSADAGRHLAATDLSGLLLGSSSSFSSQPLQRPVGGPWKELVDLPEEWKESKDPQFVSLGSGKFCIARFFSQEAEADSDDGEAFHRNFTVLTGVEVSCCGKGEGGTGKMELQMIPHISRRINNTCIETLF